jgi:plastocyanin
VKGRIAAAVALALVSACTAAPATGPQSGRGGPGATYDVQVDATTSAFNMATIAYFPSAIAVHPGDTVRFTAVDRGEPHTVTFGTLVEDALAALAKVPKGAPPGPPPPAVLKVPPALAGQLPSSIDLRQSAMQPCFIASGEPPARDACSKEQQRQPEFTGTSTFYNSGFIPGRAVFSMKLASSVKPGTYSFLCLFHGPDMQGTLTVVDPKDPVPSPDEVKAKGTDRLNKLVQALQPAVSGTKPSNATEVLAGSGDPAVKDALITDFFPKAVSVAPGTSVTWRIVVGHTISFNAPSDAVDLVVKATDGSFHLNNKAVFPVSWPGQPIPPLPGLDPPPGAPPPPLPAPNSAASSPPFAADAGSWDGKGFRSSGLLFQYDPMQAVTYRITFTQPGTYSYKCLIHVDMEGTVKVGP